LYEGLPSTSSESLLSAKQICAHTSIVGAVPAAWSTYSYFVLLILLYSCIHYSAYAVPTVCYFCSSLISGWYMSLPLRS